MPTTKIMVIRHAEKPNGEPGIMPDGAGGVTLIAWRHEAIPKIAALVRGSADGVPARWPGGRFDLVWVFDRQDNGDWRFGQAPELAMPGDSTEPIALDN